MLFKKPRAAACALQNTRPLVAIYERMGGVPEGFWDHPYVLGFLCGHAIAVGQVYTRNRLSQMQAGWVGRYVVCELAGSGRMVEVRLNHVMHDPEFRRGMEVGNKTALYPVMPDLFANDADVAAVRRHVDAVPDNKTFADDLLGKVADMTTHIGGTMIEMFWYGAVQQRLGMPA